MADAANDKQEPPAPLVWVDLEMTGLDPERCVIVEIAMVVTDGDLKVLADGPNLVVHQPESALAAMDSFVRDMHTRSGLVDRIRTSTTSLADAEAEVLAFLTAHTPKKGSPLCGNSVWKDKQFLERHMPRVVEHLHYRMIDVSTVKECVKRWYPPSYHVPQKGEKHRALDDIHESIAELRWYRDKVFIKP